MTEIVPELKRIDENVFLLCFFLFSDDMQIVCGYGAWNDSAFITVQPEMCEGYRHFTVLYKSFTDQNQVLIWTIYKFTWDVF